MEKEEIRENRKIAEKEESEVEKYAWFGFWHFVFFLTTSVIIITGLMSLIFLYFWTHVF